MREFRDRFKREAVTVKRLSHKNIVEVFDVEVEADNYYYVMEFLEGRSLRSDLEARHEAMTPEEFWTLFKSGGRGARFRAHHECRAPRRKARQHLHP